MSEDKSLDKTTCVKPQDSPEGDDKNAPKWFAMRATYRSEMSMKEKLEARNLTCFVPLVIVEKKVGSRKKRVWAPAVASLIFVYGPRDEIQRFKDGEMRLQYLCSFTRNGRGTPITIPDQQMADFIRLYESHSGEISEPKDNFTEGMRVRVIEGPFEGMEGTFQRVKGHREKRFVITIEQLVCISTVTVTPSMIVPIE